MSEIVERVARAICRAGICGPKDHLDEQEDRSWRKFELEARAAIAAMREPTRVMVNAAWNDFEYSPTGTLIREPSTCHAEPNDDLSCDTAYEVWQAMIDAALKE